MMTVVSLPPIGFEVLRALNLYRFLTVKQMLNLGIAKDVGHLRQVLAGMISAKRGKTGQVRPKEIGMIEFGVLPRIGRLSRLYYLAPDGAELLREFDPEGPDPRPILRPVRFQNDYFHRVNTIDFHITLQQFADLTGQDITINRQYFNRLPKSGKAPPRPSTSIDLSPGHLDPDSTYMLRDRDGTERLLLVEIANGPRVDRIVTKLPRYGKALAEDKINKAFNFGTRAPRIIWLFDQLRTLELVQERATNNDWIQASLPYFFMRSLHDCTPETLIENWQRPAVGQEAVSLF